MSAGDSGPFGKAEQKSATDVWANIDTHGFSRWVGRGCWPDLQTVDLGGSTALPGWPIGADGTAT